MQEDPNWVAHSICFKRGDALNGIVVEFWWVDIEYNSERIERAGDSEYGGLIGLFDSLYWLHD